jgi:hypothetical protein
VLDGDELVLAMDYEGRHADRRKDVANVDFDDGQGVRFPSRWRSRQS